MSNNLAEFASSPIKSYVLIGHIGPYHCKPKRQTDREVGTQSHGAR